MKLRYTVRNGAGEETTHKNLKVYGLAWWHIPLLPALGRQRQEYLHKFEVNLVYVVRTTCTTYEILSQKPNKQELQKVEN